MANQLLGRHHGWAHHGWDAVDWDVWLVLWCQADVADVQVGRDNKLAADGVVFGASRVLGEQACVSNVQVCEAQPHALNSMRALPHTGVPHSAVHMIIMMRDQGSAPPTDSDALAAACGKLSPVPLRAPDSPG